MSSESAEAAILKGFSSPASTVEDTGEKIIYVRTVNARGSTTHSYLTYLGRIRGRGPTQPPELLTPQEMDDHSYGLFLHRNYR